MRVFLTGAGGFIGARVLRRLLASGHDVHALLLPGESTARIDECLGECTAHEADLADGAAIASLALHVRPEAAVHLAWYAVPGVYWTSPENLRCVAQSMELATRLAENGCRRLVAAGSCAEYDWSHAELVEDHTPCEPATLYGAAKLALMGVLRKYCAEVGMGFAWTRFNFLYGPGEHPDRLVPSVVDGLLAGRDVDCSEGSQRRDFMHIDDAAAAVVAVLESDVEGPINIASGHAPPVRELVEIVAELVGGAGRPVFGALPPRPGDPPALLPSVVRLEKEVGFGPSRSLRDGLAEFVASRRAARGGA